MYGKKLWQRQVITRNITVGIYGVDDDFISIYGTLLDWW